MGSGDIKWEEPITEIHGDNTDFGYGYQIRGSEGRGYNLMWWKKGDWSLLSRHASIEEAKSAAEKHKAERMEKAG